MFSKLLQCISLPKLPPSHHVHCPVATFLFSPLSDSTVEQRAHGCLAMTVHMRTPPRKGGKRVILRGMIQWKKHEEREVTPVIWKDFHHLTPWFRLVLLGHLFKSQVCEVSSILGVARGPMMRSWWWRWWWRRWWRRWWRWRWRWWRWCIILITTTTTTTIIIIIITSIYMIILHLDMSPFSLSPPSKNSKLQITWTKINIFSTTRAAKPCRTTAKKVRMSSWHMYIYIYIIGCCICVYIRIIYHIIKNGWYDIYIHMDHLSCY